MRYRGEPARALFVWRTHGASALAVDQALRRRVEALPPGFQGTVGWSEAEPLRELIVRLALALVLAAAAAAAVGGWIGGRSGAVSLALVLAAAVAAAANAFWLAGIGLNVITLVALATGVMAAIPAALLRIAPKAKASFGALAATAIAAAAVVPVTVALASEEVGPLLSEPAKAFLLAVVGAMVAAWLVPSPPGPLSRSHEHALPGRGGVIAGGEPGAF